MMKRMEAFRMGVAAVAATVALGFGASSAQAVSQFTFDLERVEPSNSAFDLSNQFSVLVTDEGSNQVSFLISNASGGLASSIAQIYFDSDDLLDSFDSFSPSGGVAYGVGASPSALPGGNNLTPSFNQAATDFAFQADNPAPSNGINPGESLSILFDLGQNTAFADLIDSSLRIGMHVIAHPDGESDSYVTTPNGHVVPLPAAAWGGLVLLGALGAGQRFRKRRMTESV